MNNTKVIVNSVKADSKTNPRKASEERKFGSCATLDKKKE